jgi:hypothetical protein
MAQRKGPGNAAIVKILLKEEAGVNAQGGDQGSALQAAVTMESLSYCWRKGRM